MKHTKTPTGFIHQEIAPEDYVLGGIGSLPFSEYRPNADWRYYLPVEEHQSPHFETYSCTSHGTINAVEILRKMLELGTQNYSERFLAVISGTVHGGNSPHKVAEKLRKVGLVEEKEFSTLEAKTWGEYYIHINSSIRKTALEWLDTHIFKHEYIQTDPETLYQSLRTSPIGVSVAAWYQEGEFFIKPKDMQDNH